MKQYLLIFLLPLLFACGGNKDVKFVTYSTDDYSIEYPEGWSLDADTGKLYSFQIKAPRDRPEEWAENINLMVVDIADGDLHSFMFATEKEIKEYLRNSKIHLSHIAHGEKGEYYEVIYSGTITEIDNKWKCHSWVKEGRVYVLTYTARAKTYENYLPVIDKMMATFTLKE